MSRAPASASLSDGRSEGHLSVSHLSVRYADRVVIDDLSFALGGPTGMLGIVGRSGAGKSTLARALLGVGPARATGAISLCGRRVDGLGTLRRARLGLGLVPESRSLFPEFTVGETLSLSGPPRFSFDVLEARAEQRAGTLSGGELQLLAVAYALQSDPAVLILDEPSLGLAPPVLAALAAELGRRVEAGLGVIVLDHDIEWCASLISDRIEL